MSSYSIMRYIRSLPPTQIFTTRELLPLGSRGTVDQTTYKLVKQRFLTRLARGVFIKDASANPTMEEIVVAKTKAFGKRIFTYGQKLLMNLKVLPHYDEYDSTFAMDSHSSRFQTIHGEAVMKGIGPRKVKLCDFSPVGRIVYALWHRGNGVCDGFEVAIATTQLRRTERNELRMTAALMPAWLQKLCSSRFSQSVWV